MQAEEAALAMGVQESSTISKGLRPFDEGEFRGL